jgi:hypothetical protein
MRIFLAMLIMTSLVIGAEHRLDGNSLSVAFSEAGKTLDHDLVVFADGKAELPGLAKKYAFTAAPYTIDVKGKAVTFTCTLISTKHGKIVVTGTIENDKVSGTRTWSKADKDSIEHTFVGERKATAKP